MHAQRISRRRLLQLLAAAGLGLPALRQCASAGNPGNPGDPTSRTRFLAVADFGSGDANQRAVGVQMGRVHQQRPVDLVILGGDNNPQVAYRPFGMKGRFYTLRQGLVEFFMLDTNGNADWKSQLPWLQQALSRSTAPWKVVVGHHPIYASGVYGNDPAAIRRLTPLFKRYGVALYINGHVHHYERSRHLAGTTYLVVGGGGAHLRPVFASDTTAFARSTFSFAELEAIPSSLTITGWDSKGQRIDQVQLTPPPR